MKIIPESVYTNFCRLLKSRNRRIAHQNNGHTPITEWLSIYSSKSLDKVVRSFKETNLTSKNCNSTVEEFIEDNAKDAAVGRDLANDQSWDKNFITEIEGLH